MTIVKTALKFFGYIVLTSTPVWLQAFTIENKTSHDAYISVYEAILSQDSNDSAQQIWPSSVSIKWIDTTQDEVIMVKIENFCLTPLKPGQIAEVAMDKNITSCTLRISYKYPDYASMTLNKWDNLSFVSISPGSDRFTLTETIQLIKQNFEY